MLARPVDSMFQNMLYHISVLKNNFVFRAALVILHWSKWAPFINSTFLCFYYAEFFLNMIHYCLFKFMFYQHMLPFWMGVSRTHVNTAYLHHDWDLTTTFSAVDKRTSKHAIHSDFKTTPTNATIYVDGRELPS